MAKFCGNCGAKMDDNDKVCGQCGTPVDSETKTSSVKIIDMERRKRNKKLLKLIVVLILIIAVVATAINVVTKFVGPNGLLRKVMSAYEEYDIDTLVSLSSDIYYYGEDAYVENYFKNIVGATLDLFEASIGHDYQISYEVNATYTMSKRNTQETLEEIQNTYPDFDVRIIDKIIVSNITVTAKRGSDSVDEELNVIISKEDGAWKLLYIE
ncbi:zinc ribbon domain-containing protein [Agathobaculum sp. LCP25S3_E8]|uniref:zinc ribbon domain-containing protein n=1 Tax=Agathobaculum sp. LCP25S3_E8 TaxID=3438735 RepID=UPI003F8FF5A9